MKRSVNLVMGALLLVIATLLIHGMVISKPQPKVQRYGMVIGLKPEMIKKYKALHAKPWPRVIEMIRKCNIRNYSIYMAEVEPGKYYLFGYMEYIGSDFAADMKKMAADTTTQKWWKETDPCQIPVPTRKKGDWWKTVPEVFHTD